SSVSRLHFWDVKTGKLVFEFDQVGTIGSFSLSADGKLVAVCNGPNVAIWDVGNRKKQIQFVGNDHSVEKAAFSPDGKTVVCVSEGNIPDPEYKPNVGLFEVATGKRLWKVRGPQGYLQAVSFSPGGKHVAVGSVHESIRILESTSGKEEGRINTPVFSLA